MALAAAVLKAVNSAMYGLRGRVQSVQQAITYLGTREVASVTFEMGLRAVFPPAPELEAVWERSRVRGLLMGRIGSDARRRRLGRALGRPVRGMRQGGHVPPRDRALPADAARGQERRGAAAAGARAHSASATTRWAPRCAKAGAWRRRRSTACATTSSSTATLELPMHVQRRSICALVGAGACADDRPATRSTTSRARSRRRPISTRTLALRGARRVQEQIEMAVERAKTD